MIFELDLAPHIEWILPENSSGFTRCVRLRDRAHSPPLAGEPCEVVQTVGVLARFSRLLADPNRPTDAADLFRATADGRPIRMNQRVDAAEEELAARVRAELASEGFRVAMNAPTPAKKGSCIRSIATPKGTAAEHSSSK
jgi:hypothetical protein